MHAPWYGYLFWTHATQGGGVRFVRSEAAAPEPAATPLPAAPPPAPRANCSALIKVFALAGGNVPSMGQAGRTVRLAVINKDVTRACAVTLNVQGAWGEGLAVWLLPGARGAAGSGGKPTWGCAARSMAAA